MTPTRGSSPLSRGIHNITATEFSMFGIIPALAGNTRKVRHHKRDMMDHPRSRGEYRL